MQVNQRSWFVIVLTFFADCGIRVFNSGHNFLYVAQHSSYDRRIIAVISDVHGNSSALRAVLDDIARYPIDEIISLGDVVPGVYPAGCIDILASAGVMKSGSVTFCSAGSVGNMG